MRLLFFPLFLGAAAAVAAGQPEPDPADEPKRETAPHAYMPCKGSVPVFNREGCPNRPRTVALVKCRDTIAQVREESGQPALRRDTAEPDEPLLIAAVDHRIDGCGVLVMRQDTSDVRPVPEPSEGPVELIPAR